MGNALRILAATLALLCLAASPATRPAGEAAQADGGKAVVVVADGQVDEFFKSNAITRITEARELGADAVILRIDTYGGLVTAGLELSRYLKQQDDLEIVAFVDEKAISAGAMVALACDAIAMEPASMIGDSGVIAMGQGDMGETERAKAESPVLADFDDSARRNGYSDLLARSFVRANLVVYAVENLETGETRIVDGAGYERLVNGGGFGRQEETAWQPVPDVPIPLDDADSLLTISNLVAERVGLSVGTFDSVEDYAASRGMTVVATLVPGPGERLVGFLSNFGVRGILMAVMFFAVYASFSSPGTGVPEVVAVITAVVLFGVPWLTGFAGALEVLLVLVGTGLIVVELFVIPGFGFIGLTGLASVLLGLVLTFVGPLLPSGLPVGFGVEWDNLLWGLLTCLLGLLGSVGLWFWLGRYLPQLPFAKGLILEENAGDVGTPEAEARRAAWPAVGTEGQAVTDLRPGGTARFAITPQPGDTTNLDVVTDRGFVPAGSGLVVVEASGNRVVVRPTAERMRDEG